jgi:hypothetical protein
MSRLTAAGQRERDRMRDAHGGTLSPWAMLGGWFGFLRPSRLLKLLGSCAVLLAFFYVIEFRAAAEWAESQAGPRATAERIEALTVERLGLTSCPGTRRARRQADALSLVRHIRHGRDFRAGGRRNVPDRLEPRPQQNRLSRGLINRGARFGALMSATPLIAAQQLTSVGSPSCARSGLQELGMTLVSILQMP